MRKPRGRLGNRFEAFSGMVAAWAGSTGAFIAALAVVLIWAATGPFFNYSDTWQLVVNTGTTIVTFLMVFLIQRSQNKDALAVHLKLNELVAALEGSSNRLIDVEDLSEKELRALERHYRELVTLARRDADIAQSHSIEEARYRHSAKVRGSKRRE